MILLTSGKVKKQDAERERAERSAGRSEPLLWLLSCPCVLVLASKDFRLLKPKAKKVFRMNVDIYYVCRLLVD